MNALLAIAQRDVAKLLRDRPRLAVNLAFPILLIAGLGSVLRLDIGRATALDAVALAFTGVLAATAFQATAAGMISLVEDRETDFSRELFVTPVPRMVLVTGKILGETAVALGQCCCVVVFAVLFGVPMAPVRLAAMGLLATSRPTGHSCRPHAATAPCTSTPAASCSPAPARACYRLDHAVET